MGKMKISTQAELKPVFRSMYEQAETLLACGKKFHLEILSETEYKTKKQNNLFHGLLECFWDSGCSSFTDYDELRCYYKRVAGLMKKKGDFIIESSWSDVKKEQAKRTIDNLIRDMQFSGVNTKKFDDILSTIEKDNLR